MKTLDLVLKHKWYDMIESGLKTEEYREIRPCIVTGKQIGRAHV